MKDLIRKIIAMRPDELHSEPGVVNPDTAYPGRFACTIKDEKAARKVCSMGIQSSYLPEADILLKNGLPAVSGTGTSSTYRFFFVHPQVERPNAWEVPLILTTVKLGILSKFRQSRIQDSFFNNRYLHHGCLQQCPGLLAYPEIRDFPHPMPSVQEA